MGSSKLDEVPAGTRIFIDAPIFIYHFTGISRQCRAFLERCEQGELRGVTSVLTLAEVSHRLMMIEAVAGDLVSQGNVARKLRERPEIVRQLNLYRQQVEQIPMMGVAIEALDLRLFLEAAPLRTRYGFLTNDSLAAVTARERGIGALASGDRDFVRLKEVELFRPTDLESG